jgi:hypothetical protein
VEKALRDALDHAVMLEVRHKQRELYKNVRGRARGAMRFCRATVKTRVERFCRARGKTLGRGTARRSEATPPRPASARVCISPVWHAPCRTCARVYVCMAVQGTPVERYYKNPLLCGTARGNALPSVVASVYGEGLGPLASKVRCSNMSVLCEAG